MIDHWLMLPEKENQSDRWSEEDCQKYYFQPEWKKNVHNYKVKMNFGLNILSGRKFQNFYP